MTTGAFLEGKLAAFHQQGLTENPYRARGEQWQEWRRGWYAQQVRFPLPSGVTLIPTGLAFTNVRALLHKQAAALKDRLDPYVRESWEHVDKRGGTYWHKRGTLADETFEKYRQLFLEVGQIETRLAAAILDQEALEQIGYDLDALELRLEETQH